MAIYLQLLCSSNREGTGGSVVEFSPATREARVRFPASALFFLFFSNIEEMAAMTQYTNPSPLNVRMSCRDDSWQGGTARLASGFLQASLAALPRSLADDFAKFCALNYGPLPLLYKSAPGETGAPLLAGDSDVR